MRLELGLETETSEITCPSIALPGPSSQTASQLFSVLYLYRARKKLCSRICLWLKNDIVCEGNKEAYDRVGRRLDEKEISDARRFQIKSLETSEHFK